MWYTYISHCVFFFNWEKPKKNFWPNCNICQSAMYATCNNMDGPRGYHTKCSKSDRERQISYDLTYMWNLKRWYKQTYLQNRNRLTDTENKLIVTKEKRGAGRDKLGVWDWQIQTVIHKVDKQGYCIAQGNIFNIM